MESYKTDISSLIRTTEARANIRTAEKEVNALADRCIDTEDDNLDTQLHSVAAELDSLISLPRFPEIGIDVVGIAYTGTEDEIDSDIASFGAAPSNEYIGSFEDLELYGFELRRIPGEIGYRALLKCVEPETVNRVRDARPAYYFLPENIATMVSDREAVDTEILRMNLQAQAVRTRDVVGNIGDVEIEGQYTLLEDLAAASAMSVLALYADEEVHVDTSHFYEVEQDIEGMLSLTKYDNSDKQKGGRHYPMGFVSDCAFIEVAEAKKTGYCSRLTSLIEDEPSIVLTDETGTITYFIPIGSFNDALIVTEPKDSNI